MRYLRVPNDACCCGWLQMCVDAWVQAFRRYTGRDAELPDCHGKEGVAGSSPAEGS
jgi:hypothetical protein